MDEIVQGSTRSERRIKPRTGYLFRRRGGRRIRIDADESAPIYLSWRQDRKATTICLHTSDIAEAERRQANIMGRIRWENEEAYLEALATLGEEARRKLDERTGRRIDIPLDAVWQAYLDSKRRPSTSDVTQAQYRVEWNAFRAWCPRAGMREVTPAMAERYVSKRDAEVSARTINAQLTTLRRIWKLLSPSHPNPWDGLRSTQTALVTPYRPLSLAECRLAFKRASASPELALLVATGYYTAQRRKDAVLLQGEYIDLKAGIITMPPPAKTRRRKRSPVRIPIVPEYAALLREAPRTGPIMPGLATLYQSDPTAIAKQLRPIFASLNQDEGHASFHSLRATFITNMDLAGCPQRLTDQITNHAPATVRAGYSQPDSELARDYMIRALPPLDKRRTAVHRRIKAAAAAQAHVEAPAASPAAARR